jgi:hypothetical protein
VLLQAQRRPQARVAAADDADVAAHAAFEDRGVLLAVERLVEPQAPHQSAGLDVAGRPDAALTGTDGREPRRRLHRDDPGDALQTLAVRSSLDVTISLPSPLKETLVIAAV